MESCLAVEREQDKVIKKLKTLSGSASDNLQKIIDQVNALREQLKAGWPDYFLFDAHLMCIVTI